KATGANSVALGANSVAEKDNDVSIGGKILNKVTGLWDDFTRTLSGVTDGTDAHDAVNKGQLDTAKTDAIDAAKGYTDTAKTAAVNEAKGYTDTAKTAAVNEAKGYTDTAKTAAVTEAKGYTDTTANAAKTAAIDTANTHTTTEINKVLNQGSSTSAGAFSIGKDAQATGETSTATGTAS
ncbi:hypothetical protein H8467_005456, partial [Salmonella enterica]|nr:hypothetical protein [Salmonella enterica]